MTSARAFSCGRGRVHQPVVAQRLGGLRELSGSGATPRSSQERAIDGPLFIWSTEPVKLRPDSSWPATQRTKILRETIEIREARTPGASESGRRDELFQPRRGRPGWASLADRRFGVAAFEKRRELGPRRPTHRDGKPRYQGQSAAGPLMPRAPAISALPKGLPFPLVSITLLGVDSDELRVHSLTCPFEPPNRRGEFE